MYVSTRFTDFALVCCVASNLLFVDSPAGVGWSYSNTTSDYYCGDASTGRWNIHTLIVHLFKEKRKESSTPLNPLLNANCTLLISVFVIDRYAYCIGEISRENWFLFIFFKQILNGAYDDESRP